MDSNRIMHFHLVMTTFLFKMLRKIRTIALILNQIHFAIQKALENGKNGSNKNQDITQRQKGTGLLKN
jgi:hypothetical protein